MLACISLRACSYVISRARFMARRCSNSLGKRASNAAVLMSSSTAAVGVPLDLLLSYQRPVPPTSQVLREDLAVCTDLETRFVPEELCASTERLPATDKKSQRLKT